MSSLVGYVYVASNNGDTFSNAYNNDFLFVTQSNTQNILLGCSNGANAFLTISSSNATFNGSLAFNNSLTIAGLQINPSSGVSANMTQTSVSGLSNDNYGMNLYIASNTSNNYFKFFANNAELLRITGNGNLGIGNVDPQYPLDLFISTYSTSNNVALRCAGNGGSGNIVSLSLDPWLGRNSNSTLISGVDDGLFSAHLTFSTAPSNVSNTNPVERMRITSSGYVGIGNNNPKYPLDVSGNIHGVSNLYLGSNVGVGNSNYPVDPSGTTGNIVTSGNICAGNLGMFRNRIINGDMRINQRGTASSSFPANAATYTFDRIQTITVGTGACSFTNVTLANTDIPYQCGFRTSFKKIITTAYPTTSGNYVYSGQVIEGNNIQDFNWGQNFGQPITISFWSRTSGISSLPLTIKNNNATYCYNANIAVATNGTWQFNVITIQPPPPLSNGTWDVVGNNAGMLLYIGGIQYAAAGLATTTGWVNANSIGTTSSTPWITTVGNYIEFTGLQLEKGTIATPFEFRPFTVELQLCQRYFCTSYDYGLSPGSVSMNGRIGTYSPDTSTMWMMTFPVAMRATATMIAYAGNTGTAGCFNLGGNVTNYSIKYGGSSTRSALFYSDSAGAAGNYYYVHYSANAEL